MNRTLTVLLSAAIVCSCQIRTGADRQAAREKAPVKVTTVTVTSMNSICRNTYVGEVAPARSATILSPYSGTLQKLNVSKGSTVSKGSVTAVVKSQALESARQIAKANLEQAKDGYDRAMKVYSAGGITEVQMTEIRTLLTKAEASMESASKAIEDCSVKAPFKGVVSEVFPSAGMEVVLGERLMTVLDLSEMKINISVHENEINNIRKGTAASVDIPALGLTDVKAHVDDKNIVSSVMTHSYMCSLTLDSKLESLVPGMAVKVRFEETVEDGTIVVPAAAVQLDTDSKYVWLAVDGKVEKRRIVIGGYAGKGVTVSEGLVDGDKVIVEGYQKVSTGMKVTEQQ